MPSLLPDFEYDIFISYRQKDNKGDRWVSEFVEALKTELESTFKEEISIYFDENLHDGLLETHSVDKSLEGRLKCLIFIPVISQTYCDPKSFAWQHEFIAFNKRAAGDHFGRDVRLTSGNVASRILPVRIHELDPEDRKLLEDELGGALRSIEFIYKSTGVNRPLIPSDNPDKNLNKTYYRDQINKVANAVKEIITAIKKFDRQVAEVQRDIAIKEPGKPKGLNRKIIIIAALLLVLILLGALYIPKLIKSHEATDRSIAVLPFKLLTDEPEKQYLADGMMDAILLHIQKFKGLHVISRTSVEQYKGTTKAIHVIGQELDVEYLLEGSFQQDGDNVRLIVQLIKTRDDSHVWAKNYDRNWRDIFSVQTEVAETVARELYTAITPEEKRLTEKIPTSNLTAYDLYLKANEVRDKYQRTREPNDYQKAVTFYRASLQLDSAFGRVYAGLAAIYYTFSNEGDFINESNIDSGIVLVNTALSFDDQLEEAYYVKGLYYQAQGQNDDALEYYDKAIRINPNYYAAYFSQAYLLKNFKNDNLKFIENLEYALSLCRGDDRSMLLLFLANGYGNTGFIDKARHYVLEAISLQKDVPPENKTDCRSDLIWIEFISGNFDKAVKMAENEIKKDSTYLPELNWYFFSKGHKQEAYILAIRIIEYYDHVASPQESYYFNYQAYNIGFAFWQMGKYEEAEYYFRRIIDYLEGVVIARGRGKDRFTYYPLAAIYCILGDKQKAYKYLDDKQSNYYFLFRNDPMFENIRNEERFKKILHDQEVKYQSEHERVRKWLEENGKL